MKTHYNSTCAKDGGAGQEITRMPPVSKEYRDNYDAIFRKPVEAKVEVVSEIPSNCKAAK